MPLSVPDFRENGFSFSPFSMMLAIGLPCMVFIMLNYGPPIPGYFRSFIMKGCVILLKAFSESIIVFVLDSVYVMCYVYWFACILSSLHHFLKSCNHFSFIVALSEGSCGIYTGSYNVSNIHEFTLSPFSSIPQSRLEYFQQVSFLHLHTCVHILCTVFTLSPSFPTTSPHSHYCQPSFLEGLVLRDLR
jgi:hypothetical protein